MYKHMGKVMIKILQGIAVTPTMLGGLTIHRLAPWYQLIHKHINNKVNLDSVWFLLDISNI